MPPPHDRRAHEPTPQSRKLVELQATVGTSHAIISSIIEIDVKTLYKYYRAELDESLAKANGVIAGSLYNKAKNGDTTAMIFWLKTRARWREKPDADENITAPAVVSFTINPIQRGTFLPDPER